MIDFDKIELRCKEAISNGYGKHPVIECASAEVVMELITRLHQAEKDSARYRWLRDHHIGDCPEHINLDGNGGLDEAIDEAMNGSNN